MADLTDEQRIAKIEELLEKINPLNYERIFLETRLYFLKEKGAIIETKNKLDEINEQLNPLFEELRKYQIKYLVEYAGEISLTNEQKYFETRTEYLFLKTDCNIDTNENGWEPYINDATVNRLLKELQQILLYHGFFNLFINHIKKF
ncbi:MAG TPA: hypothetical protein PLE59_00060 [Bacteroidales bacterium]|jgi:hypothetical protein|nr:hypothetical protein [Candidatus Gastranaerophilales bacterium]HON97383.1 hypothetical protein [Bacteroidales bacterium]HOR82886.1 hypothetical protein [Bacteroidales bacterium]HPL01896.1 hypothetical protein [Bacteroidales bacterium]HPX76632.1 hypothetical protein [Bacteroidales bacterium]